MIEGTLESLSPEGVFSGWLRDTQDATPALLEIRHRHRPVAEAAALAFRADLLGAAHGHGHYGFAARLRHSLAPGPTDFELFLPRRDQSIRVRLVVPVLLPPHQVHVEQLLVEPPTWTAADLSRAPHCLNLADERAAMGTPRFVDVTFRFALNRWPGDEEASVYVRALDREGTSEVDFLLELLTSRERADLEPALPSPWDPLFPYTRAARLGIAA
ncbi:MAG: hypothetical protein WDN04_25125 [Rhodospirillales bacterium]